MDSRIYEKPVHKPTSAIPNEHSLRCNERLDPNDPNRHIAYTNTWQELDLQKKIKKRSKKLDKPEIRKQCVKQESEALYVWNSDPGRQGKEVYDSGEIKELNVEWWKDAVARVGKDKVLVRISTGKPVAWSNGKWIDIDVVDKEKLRELRKAIRDENTDWDNPNWQIREQCGI